MERKMNVVYDGIGFINNRGHSKYWGVSADHNAEGQWRICINSGVDNQNYTFMYSHELRNSTEELTAKLAAHLYQFRFKPIPAFIDVKVDGQYYRLDSINRQIYRLYGIVENYVVLDQDLIDEYTEELDFDLDSHLSRISLTLSRISLTQYDKDVIIDTFEDLINDELSERGKEVLKKVVNILA